MRKSYKYFTAVFVCFTLAFGFYWLQKPKVVDVRASWSKIYSDSEAAKQADYIVIGKVNEVLKGYRDGFTFTDLDIKVEREIYGSLETKNFTFVQEGGYVEDTNELYIYDGYQILKPGKSYLFFLNATEDGKYISTGGPFTVYELNGKKAKSVMSGVEKNLDNIENGIKEIKTSKI